MNRTGEDSLFSTEPEPLLPRRQWRYLLAATLAFLVIVPFLGSVVLTLRMTEIFVFIVAFTGLHVLSGRLGLISVGHGAFVGIGALGAAHSISDLGAPYLLAPVAGAVVAALAGGIVAFPSLRLPGAYLALLTVAVAMALPIAMRRIDGPLGVRIAGDLVPPPGTGLDRRSRTRSATPQARQRGSRQSSCRWHRSKVARNGRPPPRSSRDRRRSAEPRPRRVSSPGR